MSTNSSEGCGFWYYASASDVPTGTYREKRRDSEISRLLCNSFLFDVWNRRINLFRFKLRKNLFQDDDSFKLYDVDFCPKYTGRPVSSDYYSQIYMDDTWLITSSG